MISGGSPTTAGAVGVDRGGREPGYSCDVVEQPEVARAHPVSVKGYAAGDVGMA
jgi:hypothetical protein